MSEKPSVTKLPDITAGLKLAMDPLKHIGSLATDGSKIRNKRLKSESKDAKNYPNVVVLLLKRHCFPRYDLKYKRRQRKSEGVMKHNKTGEC